MPPKKLTAEEIRLRGLLLAKNKDLLQLHRELVMTGMVREEDFWDTRRDLLDSQEVLLQQKRPQAINYLGSGPDIKGSTDIAGDLKFVLTPSLIQSIFEQNPTMRRAYEELVKGTPPVMDEKGFWMAYFKSKFFKEGLASTGGSAPTSPDNPLDKYYDEAQLLDEEEAGLPDELPVSIDPAVDLVASAEDHFKAADPLQTQRPPSEKLDKYRAAIKKVNKLCLGVIESSGLHRITESADFVDTMLMDQPEDEPLPIDAAKPSLIPSTLPSKRNADDTDHNVTEREDFLRDLAKLKQGEFEPSLYSFEEYSQLMASYPLSKPNRLDASTEQVAIQPPALTSTTPEALQGFTSKLIEILKQFWSAYPPGKDANKKDKIQRMAQVLRSLRETLDGWMLATDSLEEKQFYQNSFENLMKATNHAINLAS